MKLFAKIILSLVAIYVTIWVVLASYFSFAVRHKDLLESNLSTVFKRNVSIESVYTGWDDFSPVFQINGFRVEGDLPELPALAFQSLSAKLNPISIVTLWPRFSELAINQPEVEIASLDNNRLQIAGIPLNSNKSVGINPKRLISWLLNNESAVWHDGAVLWRRQNNEIERYSDISFVYQRQQQNRSVSAAIELPEGKLAFKAASRGDIVNSTDWDADLEVLGNQGQRFLGADDLSLVVNEGKGRLLLTHLKVKQIRDFLQLTGLGGSRNWVLQSQLTGQLRDVQFDFSGPLFDFTDWALSATANEVSFNSTGNAPAMNNLNGSVKATSVGGFFDFSTTSAEFSWQRWFDESFPIDHASGRFEWDLSQANNIVVTLNNASFTDQISKVSNINASAQLSTNESRINSFAELFKVESLKNLRFEEGEVVNNADGYAISSGPIFVDASAEFEVASLPTVEHYFPKDPRIAKFRTWWKNAMLAGSASNGQIKYQGSVTKNALYDGSAQLTGRVELADVVLDYGYERGYPILSKANGSASINNHVVTITPEEAWLEEDKVDYANVAINSIFRLDRSLEIQAGMKSSLPKVMKFLFDGPLLKKEQRLTGDDMPITSDGGNVSAEVEINIPLAQVSLAKVVGKARLDNGKLTLPEGVPVSNVRGNVSFTENSATSNNIKGKFLGGDVTATLITTKAAQPPVLELAAKGRANVARLQPWVGDHLLSWVQGETDWQGTIAIDGPQAQISAKSDLLGVAVNAPAPLQKSALQTHQLSLDMEVGQSLAQSLKVEIGDDFHAAFAGDLNKTNSLLDRSMISLGGKGDVSDGINFDINYDQINLDDWLEAIIDLASLETQDSNDTLFLDSMRTIKVTANDPFLLGRQFGALELSAVSKDGDSWTGSITGDNVDGIIKAQPRADVASYQFNLSKLHITEDPEQKPPLEPIDQTLTADSYPIIELYVNSFRFVRKQLGRLYMRGEPIDGAWRLTDFQLNHQGVSTKAEGQWVNTPETGTISSFDVETVIDEAGGALQELDMGGLVSKGDGSLRANVNWIGAPHEFDYSRLNGDFDLRVQDGELVKIEPGSGKLLGLLNFNAIARRLTLDFSDVFSSGLEFDRMRYTGILADGQAIMREAYVFTPSVFVRMEGKLDIDKELIDMEIHLSPELGGNLTLLSALANPAAGAVVFLTQQIFKDEMRAASYKSYRALGTWEDFEMVEFESADEQSENATQNNSSSQTLNN